MAVNTFSDLISIIFGSFVLAFHCLSSGSLFRVGLGRPATLTRIAGTQDYLTENRRRSRLDMRALYFESRSVHAVFTSLRGLSRC
ncbi:hypothetical protein F5B19DRAFT_460211 [Rostrohypoxylon terebratum]|nr:hypothetical protein F5B19DRAFT_460211 [Rostrohypoxylon terebratum]